MTALEKPLYRFGDFELDPEERRLLAQGAPVALTPKVFDTLVLLVEHAGHVVGKDELMQALWPRGFVDESNLTKHIWLIRKTLGGDQESGFIETVPKRGYRFTAPVQCLPRTRSAVAEVSAAQPVAATSVSAPQPITAPVETAIRTDRGAALRRWPWFVAAVLLATLAAAWWMRESRAPVPVTSGGVAIVDFGNLSQNPKDAWLTPALAEMLATELSAAGSLHALPDELVQPARADLPTPVAGGYAAQSLAKLRSRLGADYVLSGSYLVSGAGDESKLRIDIALQDTRNGVAIASLSRSGAIAELPSLVTQAGSELRDKLGIASDADQLKQTANAQPPTAEVARRIGFALDALHKHDPARARDELFDAVALAPGYAPAYSLLAQAWSALGYGAKALAAAKQAAAHDEDLPEQQRLEIETQLHRTEFQWPQAAQTLDRLIALRPADPEYRLQRIDALIAAGKPDDAAAVLPGLLTLAGMRDDPRGELAAAGIANARGDAKASVEHAQRALQLAKSRGEDALAADAKLRFATSYFRSDQAAEGERFAREAIADYRRLDNPHGEAQARNTLANELVNLGRVKDAREEYERAMATYQQVGDKGGIASVYSNLARMLWAGGDLEGAETAAKRSLELRRETGDLAGQAWNLAALATAHAEEAAGDEALHEYRQAIALDEQAGARAHYVFALTSYSDLLRQRGQLDEAQAACVKARSAAAQLTDPGNGTVAIFNCAQLAFDRGRIDEAQVGLAEALKLAQADDDAFTASNVDLMRAQIDMDKDRWEAARDGLQHAAAGFAKSNMVTGEAVASALLAVCEQRLGHAAESARAAARAQELRGRITERGEVFPGDVALALLRGLNGERSEALTALRALAVDAQQRHWVSDAIDARLAELQLLEAAADPAATALREDLRKQAQALGLNEALARLARLQTEAATTTRN